jgi:hypothetical protein
MFRRTDPASQRYLATPVRRRPSLDFSVTGVVYISMMLFMGLAAINSQANLKTSRRSASIGPANGTVRITPFSSTGVPRANSWARERQPTASVN